MATLIGDDNVNLILGSPDADLLDGRGGDDFLVGGGGSDVIIGGSGNDNYQLASLDAHSFLLDGETWSASSLVDMSVTSVTGVERVLGGAGADVFVVAAGFTADLGQLVGLEGLQGDDSFTGHADITETVQYFSASGGVSVDLELGVAESIAANDAANIGVDSLTDIDNVSGSSFDDILIGDAGVNILSGGGGDDVLRGGLGGDMLQGGAGMDMASYEGSAARVVINLGTGFRSGGDAAGDKFAGIEGLTGSSHNDVLVGGQGANVLEGGDGDDMLRGGVDADTLRGGAGVDIASYAGSASAVTINLATGFRSGGDATGDLFSSIEGLTGSSHDDLLVGDAGANVLEGASGDDVLRGGAGGDALRGGAGVDMASYSDSDARVVINLGTGFRSGGDAAGDTFSNIEGLIGSAHNDVLVGSAGGNVLDGGGGDDMLRGGLGGDMLDGGAGVDVASYVGSAARVVINLETGYRIGGDAAGDTFSNIENLLGSSHNDILVGDSGANVMDGALGDDVLRGGGGDDTLLGRAGADRMTGEAGDDIFVHRPGDGQDTVMDFKRGGLDADMLDLSAHNIADFTALQALISDVDGDGRIDLGGGDLLVLEGVSTTLVGEDDVLL